MSSGKKKFDIQSVKTLLKVSTSRLKIHRNKYLEQRNQLTREIAELLSKNKQDMARIKAPSLIYLDYSIEVLNMVEVYAETIHARAQVLLLSQVCPEDLKKEIASLCYAATFLDNPELIKVRDQFIARYGRWFPEQCLQSGAVDSALIQKVKREQPDSALINFYLSAIAKKHNIDWDLPTPDQVTSSSSTSPLPNSSNNAVYTTTSVSSSAFPGTSFVYPSHGTPASIGGGYIAVTHAPPGAPALPPGTTTTTTTTYSTGTSSYPPPSGFSSPPSGFSAPPPSGFSAPPTSFSLPSTPGSYGLPPSSFSLPPNSSSFSIPSSALGSFAEMPTGSAYGLPAPTSGAPSPYGLPNPSQPGSAVPPNPYGLPNPSSGLPSYGLPSTPSTGSTYGLPSTPSTGSTYGLPSTPSTGSTYGLPPSSTGSTYGLPPSSTGSTYGLPSTPSTGSTYGLPPSSTGGAGGLSIHSLFPSTEGLPSSTGSTYGLPSAGSSLNMFPSPPTTTNPPSAPGSSLNFFPSPPVGSAPPPSSGAPIDDLDQLWSSLSLSKGQGFP